MKLVVYWETLKISINFALLFFFTFTLTEENFGLNWEQFRKKYIYYRGNSLCWTFYPKCTATYWLVYISIEKKEMLALKSKSLFDSFSAARNIRCTKILVLKFFFRRPLIQMQRCFRGISNESGCSNGMQIICKSHDENSKNTYYNYCTTSVICRRYTDKPIGIMW